jgi:hypothetical protein
MTNNNLYISLQVWDTHHDNIEAEIAIMSITQELLDLIEVYQNTINRSDIIKITIEDTVTKYLKTNTEKEYQEIEEILKPLKNNDGTDFVEITNKQYDRLSKFEEVPKATPMLDIYADGWRTCTYSPTYKKALIYTDKINIKNYDLESV